MPKRDRTRIEKYAQQLKTIYSGHPWLGRALLPRLKKLSPEHAITQPIPDMHSVYQEIHHIINWRNLAMRRLTGKTVVQIKINSPRDWPANPKRLTKTQWNALLKKLDQSQTKFLAILKAKDDSFLDTPNRRSTFEFLINGIIEHDIYHLGQIGIVAAAAKK